MNKIILVLVALILNSFSIEAQKFSCKDLLAASKSKNIGQVTRILKTVKPNCIYRGIGEPRTPLVAASRNGSLKIVKLLITADADVDFHASGDESALMAASAYGYMDIVKYLIEKKATINKTIRGDGTALISAVKNNNYQIAKLLLKNGANVDLAVRGDEYPMYHAKMNNNKKMITLLKKYQ